MLGEGLDVGRGSDVRRPPPEAWAEAERRNLAIARKRRELAGRITAEIVAGALEAGPRWYVLTVTPAHERIAAAHLVARRFGLYLPTIDEMVRERERWRFRQRPLLPGYVFIASLGLVGRWRRALACPGVTGFIAVVGDAARPAEIPQAFIDELRAYEAAQNSEVDRIHGRAFDAPTAKVRNRAGNRRKKERAKARAKELRRRLRAAAAGTRKRS